MNENTATDGKKLMNGVELAARYGVCRQTIGNWVREGKLHVIRIGRKCVRYDVERADVEIGRFAFGTREVQP